MQENIAQVIFNRWLYFAQHHRKRKHSPIFDVKRCRAKREHTEPSNRAADATRDGDWRGGRCGHGILSI